jgi:hypothetical protein
VFERVLLQTLRLSAFLKLSPKWRSQQNIRFLMKFAINVSNRIYKLGTKWNRLNLIQFPLTLNEIKWISIKAVLSQWTKGKMSHRVNERKALIILAQNIEKSLNKSQINRFSKLISNNNLLIPFKRIIITKQ